MKKHRRNRISVGLIAGVLAGIAVLAAQQQQARAFVSLFGKCNGSNTIWRGTVEVHRNSCSINTTDQISAYLNGAHQWNDYSPGVIDSFLVRPTSDCSIDHATNGQNEVGRVARGDIDGVDGRTFVDAGICGIGANDIDEADMLIANDLNLAPGDGRNFATNLGAYGRTVFPHEFGHFFGFDHENFPQTQMRTAGMGPTTGGVEVGQEVAVIWPSDSLGMSTLYGIANKANLMAGATGIVGGSIATLDPNTIVGVCTGATQTTRMYIGNAGKAATGTYSGRIQLIGPGNPVVLNFTHSLNGFTEGTFDLTFTVPGGLQAFTPYQIKLILDTGSVVSEFKENDNSAMSAKFLMPTGC